MLKNSLTTLVVMIGIAAMAFTSPARAVITEVDSHGALEIAFDSSILNNDLINTGQPSYLSASQSQATMLNYGSIVDSHDGSTSPTLINGGNGGLEWVVTGTTLTYQLNTNPGTGGSAAGYTITGIHFITGWSTPDSFADQRWNLQIATLANPTFTTAWSASNEPSTFQANMVSLTGDIGAGVTGVQFVTTNTTTASFVLREIDVLGAASPAPEPASLALLAAGGVLLLRRRRA